MPTFKCCMECKPPKRYLGCHDRCPEYIKIKKANDSIRVEKNRCNAAEYQASILATRRGTKR